nr:hypothetical protein [Planctomycetota bacterium]
CGVPRCLNQLADHSLLLGVAADESPVQEATVREALEDLKQLPLHWNDVNDSDRMIAAQAGTESDADQQSGFEDSAQDIEDSWEQETDEATVDLCELDEAHQEIDSAVANEAAIESPTDETAPLAVFEFGADESLAEDSSLDDHGEGDTLDEVAATIEVGEVETADLEPQEDAASQEEETALQAGQPSPPVAQISGVVLDLSSQVCGVSECVDGVAEFGSAISCEDSSEKTESAHADGSGPDSEFGAGIDLPEQTGVEATEEHTVDSTQPESTVFEFGAEDSSEVEPAAESESEFTNEPETSEEEPAHASELHCDSEDVPGEEKVLAEVASVEHEIVEFEASAGEAHEETEAPTEEAVLEEIAAVEREISEVDWDEKHTADDAEPVTVIDETSEPSFDFAQPDSEEPGAPDCESPHLAISNSQTSEPAGSRFEEVEVVSDPYAVIEEPLSSGIVWDVSCQTETSTEDVPHEDTVEDVAIADAAGHGDSEQESPEAVAEQFGEFPEADGIPAQIELEEAIFEPLSEPVSEELSEAIMHDWCDDNGEECAELDIVEEPSAELSLFADEAGRKEAADSEDEEVEDGGLEPAREIHPDRYIEAIVPMLGEIDEFCAKEFKADAPERDAVDIEAELVNAISGEDPAIEDEIGATVLDICLDAQWAIQQGGERADEARESARSFAEVEVESEAEGYDIVEPDFSPESDFTSQVSELGQLESTEAVSTSGQLPGRRPFGSLFSDLRRRGS